MSWLYSIVFAGLLFSSGGEQAVKHAQHNTAVQAPAAESVKRDETEKFEQSYQLDANGRVSVSNVNGSIIVEAWDRNEVKLEATKIADSRESLAAVEIKVDSRPSHFSVEADYREGDFGPGEFNRARKLEVQFRLSVPRTAVLNEVETVNGGVTVSNFVNYTKISAVNGNVLATNLQGAASLETVNGNVNADFDRLVPGSKISLSTVNGSVNLTIPSDSNATLRADSLNGEIKNAFGLPVRKGEYVGRDLYGRIGSGDVHIKLNSVNGPLNIGRKSDGKAPNPAVNLLQHKKADEEDWSGSAKIDREVARAVNRAKVEIPKIDLKELEKIKIEAPDLEKLKIDLKELEDLDIEIDEAEIDKQVKEELKKLDQDTLKELSKQASRHREALARLAQVNWPVGAPTIEKKRNTFAVKGTPKVRVHAEGCSVRIRGWDKAEVSYVVTELAGRTAREPVSITDGQKGAEVDLKVINPNEEVPYSGASPAPERVRIDIYVPRKSDLHVQTDGEIRLEGVTGDIELKGGDESINIRDVGGKLQLAADDGMVRVIGFKGELTSSTVDGDVYLEGDFARLTAKGGDGDIVLTLPEGANADISSNSDIESQGFAVSSENARSMRLGSGGKPYKFEVVDGTVRIRNAGMIAGN